MYTNTMEFSRMARWLHGSISITTVTPFRSETHGEGNWRKQGNNGVYNPITINFPLFWIDPFKKHPSSNSASDDWLPRWHWLMTKFWKSKNSWVKKTQVLKSQLLRAEAGAPGGLLKLREFQWLLHRRKAEKDSWPKDISTSKLSNFHDQVIAWRLTHRHDPVIHSTLGHPRKNELDMS